MASSSTASDTEYLIPEWFFENSDEMDHVSIPGWFFEPSNDLEFANPDMTPENAVPNLLGSSNPAYVLPGWFMERNVKTPLELTRMPNQIVFCDCKDCEEAKADDEAFEDEEQWATQTSAGVKNVGEPGQHTDTIHYKTFAELCDTTFLTFAPGDEGKLAFPRDSSVVYRVEKPSTCSCCSGTSIVEPVWMDRAVVQLAKKLAFASLISFDFEDLEELGYDFHRQDNQAKKRCTDDEDEGTDSTAKSWDPDMESFTTYLEQFFAIRSERHANTESWQRNQRVMSAVLDAATSKTTTEGAKNESGQQPDSGAILIHIIDCSFVNEALGRRVKRRVLTRFAAMVQAKREEGQAVSMLLSTKSSSYKPGEKEYRKIGGTIGSTVTASNDTIRDLDSREKLRKGIINSRRMRRFMRQEVSHLFSSEFLDDSSDWASADRGKNYKSFGDKLWSTVEMRRVLAQLMGRGWRSGKPRTRLDFADVRAVLRRIGLFTQVDADTDGQTGNEENEATKNLNLNRYEEDLRECVVNRGALKTEWEDVIIDTETKELLQLVVSSARLQTHSSSEFLEEVLRIRGVLLYGPPGTGKTHLARAVARASGSRMLVVDYAKLQSKWVGESEKLIEAAFTLASKLHPCILFIDEVDALFYRRSSSDHRWERSALAQFLQGMDGLAQKNQAPVMIVATNRPWDLDEAFLRRLQEKIYIGLPDVDSRSSILRLFLKEDDLDPEVNIDGLAQVTEKYSGSDLKSLCAHAALVWRLETARINTLHNSLSTKFSKANRGLKKIRLTVEHFVQALDRIQPNEATELLHSLQKFSKKYDPKGSNSGKNPSIRFIYNSSTKRHEQFHVRELICRACPSEEKSIAEQDEWENGMQVSAWCQLDLRDHFMSLQHTTPAPMNLSILASQESVAPMDAPPSTNLPAVADSEPDTRPTSPATSLSGTKDKEPTEDPGFYHKTLGPDEIRILTVYPGEPGSPLRCTLKVSTFGSYEKYCALSYTSGSTEPPFFMNCDGTELRITQSLHDALCRLRTKSVRRPIKVWADAVCINQGDYAEKAVQIMRTGDIYSEAAKIFIWLGNPASPSDASMAMKTLTKIYQSILRSLARLGSKVSVNTFAAGPYTATHARIQQVFEESQLSKNEWQKVYDLVCVPWFTRTKAFQKLVLPKVDESGTGIIVGYGDRTISWQPLRLVQLCFETLKSSALTTVPAPRFSNCYEETNPDPPGIDELPYNFDIALGIEVDEEPPSYIYSPLMEGEIRLLYSDCSRGEISWSLRVAQLTNAESQRTAYDALSYTWGDLSDTIPFLCNGRIFNIHKNLHDALPFVARRRSPRPIWIDAVCINQADETEKFTQIQKMQIIYQQARQIWVWLRSDVPADVSRQAAALLPRIAEAGKEFYELCEEFETRDGGGELWLNMKENLTHPTPESKDLPPVSSPVWGAIHELIRNDWFSRLWIIQEVGLDRDVKVMYGPHEIQWRVLVEAATNGCLLIHCLRDVRGNQPFKTEGLGGKQSHPPALIIVRQILQSRSLSSMPKLASVLVQTAEMTECSDPRDRIFGVLGFIAPEEVNEIGLNGSMELAELYTRTTHFLLAKLDARSDEWWQLFGLGTDSPATSTKASGIPTWCPDFHNVNRGLQGSLLAYSGAPRILNWHSFRASRATGFPQQRGNVHKLTVRGKIFDSVQRAFPPLPTPEDFDDWTSMGPFLPDSRRKLLATIRSLLAWDLNIAKDVLGPVQDDIPPATTLSDSPGPCGGRVSWDGYWRVLVGDRHDILSRDRSFDLSFESFCTFRRRGNRIEDFFRMVDEDDDTEFRALFERVGTGEESDQGLLEKIEEACGIIIRHSIENLGVSESIFTATMMTFMRGRLPFSTEGGCFGAGPESLKEHDVVCVLNNAKTAHILRPTHEDGTYELVGEAYVHGMMDGEVEDLNIEEVDMELI